MTEAPTPIFSDGEREVILFIERYHSENGVVPNDEQVKDYLLAVGIHHCNLDELKEDPRFLRSMDLRGIDINLKYGQLSAKQMAAVAIMMSYIDRRSDEKKLRDLGLSPKEWASWLQDETFARYLNNYSERLITNSTHEAHLGLVRSMRSGNTASIKLFYELTGRYKDDANNAVDTKLLIYKIIEIIQKYVKEPDVLASLSTEMMQLSAVVDQIQSGQQIKGQLVK